MDFIHYVSVHPEKEDIEGQAFHNGITAIFKSHNSTDIKLGTIFLRIVSVS